MGDWSISEVENLIEINSQEELDETQWKIPQLSKGESSLHYLINFGYEENPAIIPSSIQWSDSYYYIGGIYVAKGIDVGNVNIITFGCGEVHIQQKEGCVGPKVIARDCSDVEALNNVHVTSFDAASVLGEDCQKICMYDCSSAVARGHSVIEAYDASDFEAYGSTYVECYDSSHVYAYDQAFVALKNQAGADAYDESIIFAKNNSWVSIRPNYKGMVRGFDKTMITDFSEDMKKKRKYKIAAQDLVHVFSYLDKRPKTVQLKGNAQFTQMTKNGVLPEDDTD